jgi:hypothetical protein
MSTKKKGRGLSASEKSNVALLTIARKKIMGKEAAEKSELLCLVHFDSIRRGVCGKEGRNLIGFHLLTALFVGTALKSDVLMDAARRAYEDLSKAASRPDANLRLTTGEYASIRDLFKLYFAHLQYVEIGTMSDCSLAAKNLFASNSEPMQDCIAA